MLRLSVLIFIFSLCVKAHAQKASLFVYSADSKLFNIALNQSDSFAMASTGFEVINIDTEIQGLKVFVDNLLAYKKRLFLRLGDSTCVVIKNNSLHYVEKIPEDVGFIKVDAQNFTSKAKPITTDNEKQIADKTQPESKDDVELRYTYPEKKNLGANAFLIPSMVEEEKDSCNYTLDDKDLRRLRSKLKIFPDAFDQVRMLEQDLEYTCLNTNQLQEIMQNIDNEEARYVLSKKLWGQCTDKENMLKLSELFNEDGYRFNFQEFLKDQRNEKN